MNPKRPTPRQIILKRQVKDNETILKTAREKQLVMYKENPIRLSAYFLAEALQSKMECHNIAKLLGVEGTSTQEYSSQKSYHSELKER